MNTEKSTPASPSAAAADERERFEAKFPKPAGVEWIGEGYEVKDSYANSYACDRYIGQWIAWLAAKSSALTPPVAASGQADTERLDWLEQSACERLSVKLYGSRRKAAFSVELWGDDDDQTMGESLRAAIDAARAHQPPAGGGSHE